MLDGGEGGSTVYPRPRGEYMARRAYLDGGWGLPPPTRGILQCPMCPRAAPRSTPAHAGNTGAWAGRCSPIRVYPRPRGEYAIRADWLMNDRGLPPPTRGILLPQLVHAISARSTPAHAGNTMRQVGWSYNWEVYPRPRGEYERKRAINLCQIGLPPPTRGILAQTAHHASRGRSTPAHAGNTRIRPHASCMSAVYPRPRGEYAPPLRLFLSSSGLPPPTRGIRTRLRSSRISWRSTPAHAGNTSSLLNQRALA